MVLYSRRRRSYQLSLTMPDRWQEAWIPHLPDLDWRIADYCISQRGLTRHPQSLTTGLVIRF